MDEPRPQGSIALYGGRKLTLYPEDPGFVLRHLRTTVAVLHDLPGPAETTDGRWWVDNPHGTAINARRGEGGELVATYRAAALGGGTIRLAGGSRYAVRPPLLGSAVRLRRRRALRTLAAIERNGLWDVEITDAGAAEPDFALVLVVALHALRLEEAMPFITGSASGG